MLKEIIDKFYSLKQKHRDRKPAFYISEVGKCPRAIWFSLKNYPKKPMKPRVARVLEHGDHTHMRLMSVLFSMGLVKAAEIEIPANEFIKGRADAIITIDNEQYVLEIKSINKTNFLKTEPIKEHVMQLRLYMHFFKIKKGILIYENKDNQELKEYVINQDDVMTKNLFAAFNKIKEKFEKNEVPEIPKDLKKWVCKYCDYYEECKKIFKK